jgi:Cu+-exporting ATPase
MMKQTLNVMDMHCSNCCMKIEALEDELAGVKSVSASYVKGRVVVEFDEGKITLEEIVEGVKRKGYTVRD